MSELSPDERQRLGLEPAASSPVGTATETVPSTSSVYTPDQMAQINRTADGKQVTLEGWVADRARLVGQHYRDGDDTFMQSLGYVPSALGMEDFKDADARLNDAAIRQMKKAKMDLLEKAVPAGDVTRLIMPAIDSLAYTKNMWKAAAIGDVVGAAGGVAVGVAAGAAAAAPTGEAGAPVTIPAGIAAGATIGGLLGGTAASYTLGANVALGATWKRLKEANVPDDRARQLSIANGIIQGGIETAQTMLLGGIGRKAFSPILKTPAGHALMTNAVLSYLKSIGYEALEEGTQSLVDDLIDELSNEPSIKPSPEDYWKHFIQNLGQGAQSAVFLGAGSYGVGKTLRTAGDAIADSKNQTFLAKTIREIITSRRAAEAEAKQKREEEIAKMMVEAKLADKAPTSDPKLGEALGGKPDKAAKAQLTVDQAEDERKKLKDKEKDIIKQFGDLVIQGKVVPESLRQELKETRQQLNEAVRDKARAVKLARKAELEKRFADKNLTATEQAQLIQEIDDIDTKLREEKVKQAVAETTDKIEILDEEIAEREVELEAQRELEDDELVEAGYRNAEAKRKSLKAEIDQLQADIDKRMAGNKLVPRTWNKRMDDLQEQLKAAQEEKKTAKISWKDRVDLEHRLDEAIEERDALTDQRTAMQNGLLTDADIDALDTVLAPNKRNEVVRKVIHNVLNAIKKQKQLTAESVGENFALLRDFITKSGLTKEGQGKLLGALNIDKFKDAESVQKNLPMLKLRLNELMAEEAHAQAVKRLQKALKLVQPSKNGANKNSKFDPEVQRLIDIYEEFINDPGAAIEAYQLNFDGNVFSQMDQLDDTPSNRLRMERRIVTARTALEEAIEEWRAATNAPPLFDRPAADIAKINKLHTIARSLGSELLREMTTAPWLGVLTDKGTPDWDGFKKAFIDHRFTLPNAIFLADLSDRLRVGYVLGDMRRGKNAYGDKYGLVTLYDIANVATLLHEMAHVARMVLFTEDQSRKAAEAIGVINGVWTRDNEEHFARAFERYMREGKTSITSLEGIFRRMKTWFAAIYHTVFGSSIDAPLNAQLREVFDEMLGKDLYAGKSAVIDPRVPLNQAAKWQGMDVDGDTVAQIGENWVMWNSDKKRWVPCEEPTIAKAEGIDVHRLRSIIDKLVSMNAGEEDADEDALNDYYDSLSGADQTRAAKLITVLRATRGRMHPSQEKDAVLLTAIIIETAAIISGNGLDKTYDQVDFKRGKARSHMSFANVFNQLAENDGGDVLDFVAAQHTRRVIAGHVLNTGGVQIAANIRSLEAKLERLYQNFTQEQVVHADGSTTTRPGVPLLTLSKQQRGVLNKEVAQTKFELRQAEAELLASQAKHVNKLTARILKLNRIGRDKRIAARTEEVKADEALRDEAVAGVKGHSLDEWVNLDHAASEPSRTERGAKHNVERWLRTAGKDEFSWEGKLKIIFQDMKNSKGIVRKLNRLFVDAGRKYDTQKRIQMDNWMNHMVAATGMKRKDILKQMVKGANESITLYYQPAQAGKWKGVDNGELTMTRNEAIQLYLQMMDESLHKGLREGNGYSLRGETAYMQSTQEQLEEALNPSDKKMARGILAFYKEQYDRLNEEYEAHTGLQLDFNAFYSGMAYRDGFKPDQVNEEFQAQLQSMTAFQGGGKHTKGRSKNTIGRINSDKELMPKDVFANVIQSIQLVEHYRAWREPSARLSAVLDDHKFRRAVELKFGHKMMAALNEHYQDGIKNSLMRDHAWSDAVSNIMRNYATALLAMKPLQLGKQLTSITNFLLVINEFELMAGINDFIHDPERAMKVLSSSEIFKNRYASFDLQKAGFALKQDVKNLAEQDTRNALMWFLRTGDKGAVLVGGWAVYKAVYDKTGDAAKAMQAFEDAFDTTQSSGNIDQLSNLSRNPLTRTMMMFLQQPTRLWEFAMTSCREAVNNPTPANMYNALHTIAVVNISTAAFGAVGFGWVLLTEGDDDEKKDKAFWQWMMSILESNFPPIISDVISMAATVTHNVTNDKGERDYRSYDLNIPILEVANKSIDLYREILEGFQTEDFDERRMLRIWMLWARSGNMLIGGLPLEPIGEMTRLLTGIELAKPKRYNIESLPDL